MKAEKNQLPLRNVYENLALMVFMSALLIVSLLSKAEAMMN